MEKKHQITIVEAIPTPNQSLYGYMPPPLTKGFKNGLKADWTYKDKKTGKIKKSHAIYYKQEIFEFDNLSQLFYKIRPYIEGTHPNSFHSALMYGSFIEGTETPYGWQRINTNIQDNHSKYLILDIETEDSPQTAEICLDLSKIRQWMVATYPWITDKTGMILYHTASAGVVLKDGSNKHQQIRVRAIVEVNAGYPGLNESYRKANLRKWMKHNQGKDFDNHIDPVSHEKGRLFYMAPPILEKTDRLIGNKATDICRLYEGDPIDYEAFRLPIDVLPLAEGEGVYRSNPLPSPSYDKSIDERKLFRDLKEKPPEWHWEKIEDGFRNRGHYNLLVSAYIRGQIKEWRLKLLQDKFKLGDRTVENIDYTIKYIEERWVKSFDKPTELDKNHNIIELDEYLLKDCNNKIEWKDKGVILQRLYEGAGKTQSLKELREIAEKNNKSFLYLAPNTKPTITACSDLNLTPYTGLQESLADTKKDGSPTYPYLGICYPSLDYLDGEGDNSIKDIHWDFLVIDEIEQLLVFAISDNRQILLDPEKTNHILRHLVEEAELVVGLDARISDITVMALEHWRNEKVFDLYTQSKIKPWKKHQITMVENLETTLDYIITAVNKGQRVAVVSELSRDAKNKINLEYLKNYIQEQTGKQGWAVDQDNKDKGISNKYINELGIVDHDKKKTIKIGALEQDLKDGVISHIWCSPVLQSAWSYLSYEAPFDLVVGIYPNSVLTAPNIIQHISRFRGTTRFVMHIEEKKRYRPWEIYKEMHPRLKVKGEKQLQVGEFNMRKKIEDRYTHIGLTNRRTHFIEIAEKRGAKVNYDDELLIKEDKQLANWLRHNYEKAWELVRSRKAWVTYNKLQTQDRKEIEALTNELALFELDPEKYIEDMKKLDKE